jgi:integrase
MTATNKLTDLKIKDIARQAKLAPPAKATKYPDGGGLFLVNTPAGALLWRMKYRVAGAEKLLSFGAYPLLSLAAARAKRDEAKRVIAEGGDPAAEKQAAKKAAAAPAIELPTFARFAREVLAFEEPRQAPQTLAKWRLHLGYAIAAFGPRPIAEITAPELLQFLEGFGDRGDTLHSIKRKISDVFDRATFAGACQGNPTQALKNFLLPARGKHHASITDPERFAELIFAIDGHKGHPSVRGALLFLALTFQRPHMVREMEWAHVNWQAKRWEIPADKMKGKPGAKVDHVVPLSDPALAILRAMLPLTGDGALVFAGRYGTKPMNETSLNRALRERGIGPGDHVAHGFRASANTLLKEHLAARIAERLPLAQIGLQEIIDRQLAHVVGDQTRRAYDRVGLIAERAIVMEIWGEFFEECRGRAPKVAQLRPAAA